MTKLCSKSDIGKRVTLTKVDQDNHSFQFPCKVFEGLGGIIERVNEEGSPHVIWDNGSNCCACLSDGDEIKMSGSGRKVVEILNDPI